MLVTKDVESNLKEKAQNKLEEETYNSSFPFFIFFSDLNDSQHQVPCLRL